MASKRTARDAPDGHRSPQATHYAPLRTELHAGSPPTSRAGGGERSADPSRRRAAAPQRRIRRRYRLAGRRRYDGPVATPSPPLRLAYKLILPLTLVVAVVAGVSGVLRVSAVERGLRQTMVVGADQVSRGITNATWHAMLADDRPTAYDLMKTIARGPGISRIRIFNKEGRIMFSTADEAAKVVDKKAEACVLCHTGDRTLVNVRRHPPGPVSIAARTAARRLAMITPIYNEPSCSTAACHAHPANMRVLGVLDVAMDLSPVDAEVGAVKVRVLVTTLVEIALISASLILFLHLLVTRPIRRLVDAAGAVSRMELEHEVEDREQPGALAPRPLVRRHARCVCARPWPRSTGRP